VSGQVGDELGAGISVFVKLCSEFGLACAPTRSFGMGNPVRFDLSKGNKEVQVNLGYEFLTDLPATEQYHSALRSYLTELALRLPNHSFAEYATLSGIPITLNIEFPLSRSTEGGDFQFVHVHAKTGIDTVFEANFSVHLTHTILVSIGSLEFVITEPLIVNAVRKFVDARQALFYPEGKHPIDLQVVTIGSSAYDHKAKRVVFQRATDEQVAAFLKRKVYWLGFRRGTQATRVCIADLYDAEYLGVSHERLQQAGAILAAEGFVQLDSSGMYASASTKLLQESRTIDSERAAFLGAPSSVSEPIQFPSGTSEREDTPLFDVFISHATEDKEYVQPLVDALKAAGINVWFDKTTLEWGDDLRASIDRGLTGCRYGIVVFSQAFLRKKKWTEYELNSLFAREEVGKKLILPIWHKITREDLIQYSPAFAGRLAKLTSSDSYADIVESLLAKLGRTNPQQRSEARSEITVAEMPGELKPNAVAFAHYETKGPNALRAEAYVRPSTQREGWYTFENSLGEKQHGTMEQIALRFVGFDRSLTIKGYVRMRHGNSNGRAFDL